VQTCGSFESDRQPPIGGFRETSRRGRVENVMEATQAPAAVEVRAIETLADLLFTVKSDEPGVVFFNRLCEATCRLGEMDRAAVFFYDPELNRVQVVGSHGISIEAFRDVHWDVGSAPMALRALREDRVLEATEGFAELLPPEYERYFHDTRLVCTPVAAGGRWPGVIFSDRPVDRPLTDGERHLLWSFGKIAALADSARVATREHERARQLQERIDLARDVHDGVIQRLFGVSLALSGETLAPEQVRRCAVETQEALGELRAALQRPLGRASPQTETTLADEVRRLAAARPDAGIVLEDGADGVAVPAHLEPLAQSVLREAVRNAVKHASPRSVRVRLERTDGAFALAVRNDGVPETARQRTGMGLRLAALEALQHGGVIEFGRTGGGRWEVRLLVPLEGGRA
jgi:signal transduction histidine kinase